MKLQDLPLHLKISAAACPSTNPNIPFFPHALPLSLSKTPTILPPNPNHGFLLSFSLVTQMVWCLAELACASLPPFYTSPWLVYFSSTIIFFDLSKSSYSSFFASKVPFYSSSPQFHVLFSTSSLDLFTNIIEPYLNVPSNASCLMSKRISLLYVTGRDSCPLA